MSVIIPFWLVAAQSGWRGMLGVWPACLVCGVSFGITQFLVSNLHGPWLVGIVAAFVSMGSLMVLLRFWKPSEEQSDAGGSSPEPVVSAQSSPAWKAWLPWILLSVLVFVWGIPTVKHLLNGIFAPNLTVPGLHNRVLRTPPVVPVATSEKAVFV